jgi:hypothetical protein
MKTRLLTSFVTACLCGILLNGCFLNSPLEPQVTTEDPSITADNSGQLAVSTIATASEIEALSTEGLSAMEILNSTNANVISMNKSLLKSQSAPVITIDSSKITQGILILIIYTKHLLFEEYDTVSVKMNAFATNATTGDEDLISLKGKKVFLLYTEYYSLTDADGDGIVASGNNNTYNIKALLESTKIYNGGAGHSANEKHYANMLIDAGPDKNFGSDETPGPREDNMTVSLLWNRTLNNDTLGSAIFTDVDGDGYILDKKRAGGSIIDIATFNTLPAGRPFVKSNRLNIRVITDGLNSAKDKIIKLNGEETLINGRTTSISAKDSTGSDIIEENEKVYFTIKTVKQGVGDTIRTSEVTYVFKPEGALNSINKKVYEVHYSENKINRPIASTKLDFITTEPYLAGTKPTQGQLVLVVTFTDGKTESINATFKKDQSFNGTYTDRNGTITTITWSKDGTVIPGN